MRRLLTVWLALLALALGGCAHSVPPVPAWRAPANARTYTSLEVRTEIARLAPLATIYTSDNTFIALNHEWLVATLDWSWHFAKAIGFSYTAESGDCEKFSVMLSLAANVAAMRAGVKAQPLSARTDVRQVEPFGGVPAGGAHALNAVFTDRPPHYWVVEPQSRKIIPLEEYPNREFVFAVRIGG